MQAGSAGELGRQHGSEQVGFWRKIVEHPTYDSFWRDQAMDKILAAQPLKVPVMLVDSLWDQEDIYGAVAVYKAIEAKERIIAKSFFARGPGVTAKRFTRVVRSAQSSSAVIRR